jgi:2-polyprenyl-3-methyl-5-hydroxy-6-metoxy-1,4-benzoquinol methylase
MLEDRAIAEELMDAPDLDPGNYDALLKDLAQVTTVTMGRDATISFLERAIGGSKRFRLLDVGYGHGDMLRAIAKWAARLGIEAELVGIDLNPKSESVARDATPADMPIRYLTGDYASLAGQEFDFIISSLVAHHMTRSQLVAFVRFMDTEAKQGWLVNDLHRHSLAWIGFPALAFVMRWHPIVRHDGQLSIARSYRPREWLPLLAEAKVKDARIYRAFPFRLCVEKIR